MPGVEKKSRLKELMARLGHSSVRAAMGRSSARYTTPRKRRRRNRNAESRAHDPRDRVARVWHARPGHAKHGMRSNTEKYL
jgi:hypothetical protein